MAHYSIETSFQTYLNPVYQKSFPDPFVLKFRGEYFAYCTDFWRDGKVFGVLRSRDLVNWQEIGGAMIPLENSPPFYWAPEVTYSNGKFYLYYSVGNETLMEIRVAVSDQPDQNFIDSGKHLTYEDFAIDAHLFTDEDGQKYLFYATDFLKHTHIGTGTVIDRMLDFYTLEGKPRPVTRAKYDWQVYDTNRIEKGGVRWHTVEGAFVIKRKSVYYEMFSGGNWQNVTYGVSFAITDNLEKTGEWEQFSDGEKVLPILRTLPGVVTGPGHNSVIRGLNNRELFCIYHRWTKQSRVLAIDRMDFTGGGRMFIFGATTSPQPAPCKPALLDFFDDFSDENWKIVSGKWETKENQIISGISKTAELECKYESQCFLLEISLRLIADTNGKFGIYLNNDKTRICKFLLDINEKQIQVNWLKDGSSKTIFFKLPDDFDFQSFHLLRVDIDYLTVKISLDEHLAVFQQSLDKIPVRFSLAAENCQAAFSGAALTIGFENLFEENDLETRGWRLISNDGDWQIKDKNLVIKNQGADKTFLKKDFPTENYELVFNFCLMETFNSDFKFGLSFLFNENEAVSFVLSGKAGTGWIIQAETSEKNILFSLPKEFSPDVFQQIGFLKIENELVLKFETKTIGVITFSQKITGISFFVQNAVATFDMIRLTAL